MYFVDACDGARPACKFVYGTEAVTAIWEWSLINLKFVLEILLRFRI